MAFNLTLARPYAKALFEIAKNENNYELWSNYLALLSVVITEKHVKKFIANQTVAKAEKAKLLALILKKHIDERVVNLLLLLSENNRLEILGDIKTLFEQYKNAALNMMLVTITSAVKLSPTQQKEHLASLEKFFAKKIEAHFVVDETLLGGILVKSGSKVFDFSLFGKLSKLQETLAV